MEREADEIVSDVPAAFGRSVPHPHDGARVGGRDARVRALVPERVCPKAWIGVSSLQKGQSLERYVRHPLLARGGTDGDIGGDFRIAASGSAASVLRLL